MEKHYRGSLKKLKVDFLYGPAVPLLGMHTEKLKMLIQKDICTPVSIEALARDMEAT